MWLAAMLAMVLAAAAPALGQQIGGDQGPVGGEHAVQAGDNVQYAAVCQDLIGALEAEAAQAGFSDAAAFAEENAAAVTEVAQSQDISVAQANECLNVWFASPTATATASATAGGGGGGAAAAGGSLPATGGASLIALGAGVLLVTGGLLARWIVRR